MNYDDHDNVINLLEFKQRLKRELAEKEAGEWVNHDVFYMGASIVDILGAAGLDQDLHTDAANPKNRSYCIRLTDEAEERLAEGMAAAIFSAVIELRANDVGFDPDKAYEQCLIDARHMILDESYARLFGLPH
jgi:hypothetical protein